MPEDLEVLISVDFNKCRILSGRTRWLEAAKLKLLECGYPTLS